MDLRGESIRVVPPGAITARTLKERFDDVLNIEDFGAKCDGKTDDAAAINATFGYVRSAGRLIGGTRTARIVFPQGHCIVGTTLNWTGLQFAGITIEGSGAVITARTAGTPAIDGLGSRWLRVRDLTLRGDTTNPPNVGIRIGRTNTTALNSSDNHSFENVFLTGNYSLAAFYNLNAETTKFDHVHFWNGYPGANSYSLIQDGLNHFNLPSSLVTQSQPVDTPQSFNENLFLNCDFRHFGGGTPIWSAQTSRHRYIASYAANTAGAYGMKLFSLANTDANQMLDLDLHFETNALTDVFLLTGSNASPSLQNFKYRDGNPFATNSIFKLDAGVTSVRMHGVVLEVGSFPGNARMFAEPGAWTVTGQAYVSSVTAWNLPATAFAGLLNLGSTVVGGAGVQAFGSGLALNAGTLSVSLPTPLPVSAIASQGGVTSLTRTNSGTWRIPAGTSTFPTLTLGAPPTGGAQATAVVSDLVMFGFDSIGSAGSGYTVGDILTVSGGSATTPFQARVTAVDGGGGITGYAGYRTGSGVTVVPAAPFTFSGGTGSGFTGGLASYGMGTTTVTATGSYATAPTVSVAYPAAITPFGTSAALTAVIGNTFSASGGGYQSLMLDGSAARLGSAGTTGVPLVSAGALIDGSGVRHALSSSYTVPSNTSLVRFTQSSTVTSSTVTMPTARGDGHPIQFVNYGGAVTALTFSPSVVGWTNGNTLSAYTGLRVRWDTTSAAWMREQ